MDVAAFGFLVGRSKFTTRCHHRTEANARYSSNVRAPDSSVISAILQVRSTQRLAVRMTTSSRNLQAEDLQRVLRRGKQRDMLGEKIDHALALINAVLDQLG